MSERLNFKLLESELLPYRAVLSQAADTIIEQGVSDFPIFVVHQHQIEIGIPLIDKEEVKGNWSINASSMEEFIARQVIQNDKVDEFQRVYKNPDEALCLFVLSELGATFIFLPRKE